MRYWSVRLPRAQTIVLSDHHLLELKIYQGIPILTASELSSRITPTAPSAP